MEIDLQELTFEPGQLIESGEEKWEVVSYEDKVLKIKPIAMSPHMSSRAGRSYMKMYLKPLFHNHQCEFEKTYWKF